MAKSATPKAAPKRPAPKRPAPAWTPPPPRVIDLTLLQDAKFLLSDGLAMEYVEAQRKFLIDHIGQGQSIVNDRQDIAGLKFLTEAISILNRVAGGEDE